MDWEQKKRGCFNYNQHSAIQSLHQHSDWRATQEVPTHTHTHTHTHGSGLNPEHTSSNPVQRLIPLHLTSENSSAAGKARRFTQGRLGSAFHVGNNHTVQPLSMGRDGNLQNYLSKFYFSSLSNQLWAMVSF